MKTKEQKSAAQRKWRSRNAHKVAEYDKRYTAKNRAALSAAARERYAKSPERRRKAIEYSKATRLKRPLAHRAWKFGLTENELDAMLTGGCAICGANPEADGKTILHVDHDHSTGRVRGILCSHCNLGLGHFCDSPINLARAAAYLTTAAAQHANLGPLPPRKKRPRVARACENLDAVTRQSALFGDQS